jgi:hypothetical protein
MLLRPRPDRLGALTAEWNDVLRGVARAVLDGTLPREDPERTRVLDAHMQRLAETISGLPAAARAELAQLLSVLAFGPGRLLFAGLASPWPSATTEQILESLQSMRTSSLQLRMQAYHALRDLTYAAYFADPSTWPAIGYPGPRTL